MTAPIQSPNFGFLRSYNEQLTRLGALAERYFKDDPNTSLIKLRQFGETLAQLVAASSGRYEEEESQANLLKRLKYENVIPLEAGDLFHFLRLSGNKATHGTTSNHAEALSALKVARELGIWFHKTYGTDPHFSPGAFIPPADPETATKELQHELTRLHEELDKSRNEAERARAVAEQEAIARMSAEEKAAKELEEKLVLQSLAEEAEKAKNDLSEQLSALQVVSEPIDLKALIAKAGKAANAIKLDEAATRAIIDAQLRDAGWETDTENLRYSGGSRPERGKNKAIAEWPTKNGPADYALFIGTECYAIVEAKRSSRNISADIDQAERYSKGFKAGSGYAPPSEGPWNEYKIPFVFATNGRPYLKQIETESGIWFRDVRANTYHRRALNGWYSPDGLKKLLETDRDKANSKLKSTPIEFAFDLRPYQKQAIEAVETELENDRRAMLLAMATGTGKTKLAIALLYRLLESKRFRRVCFIVDRSALGEQAAGEFKTTKVVSAKAFADIFGLKELKDTAPDLETKIHICTIQSLVKRVLYADDPASIPSIDQYDLLVIDECHRGYLLDKEMSDDEMEFLSEEDYISKYRRVLEHFDATKIGLTATPALHTVKIFGDPIYTYSYREAVIDGYLIDHQPPLRIKTKLGADGILYAQGEVMDVLDLNTGTVSQAVTKDDVEFNVEDFHKKVITVEFNRVVAEAVAEHIDPSFPGKTLIFAVNDSHADLVVKELKTAMANRWGEVEDAAIRKITGSVDRVGKLIRSYRNDSFPKIAVTVDLLTTGIDVPKIENLVFLRRVNSRILYEQMLGRATRRCDEIGKETFRIFDAVDIYSNLQKVTDMRPVVTNPNKTLRNILTEFIEAKDDRHRELLRDQIVVKIRRQINKLNEVERDTYISIAGETPEQTIARLKNDAPGDLAQWFNTRQQLVDVFDKKEAAGASRPIVISNHDDKLISVSHEYGNYEQPEDFIEGFTSYIKNNVNKIAALTIVVQRPRELTRKQLRELKVELDKSGFMEAALKRAWIDAKNEDIAASIIGYVRQAAIGDPLIPYDQRVKSAMLRILSKHKWSDPQRKWLKRIETHILKETIVDRDAINNDEPFKSDGGFNKLNRVFNGELEQLLGDIQEEVWRPAA